MGPFFLGQPLLALVVWPGALKPLQIPLLAVGMALFLVPAALYWQGFLENIRAVLSDPPLLVAGVAAVLVVAPAVVKWQTRGERTTMV